MGKGLSNFDIIKYMKKFKIPNFLGVFAADELPQKIPQNSSLIINYSNSNQDGTHWVAMMRLNNPKLPPAYFDSYGYEPDVRARNYQNKTNFRKYLKDHSPTGDYIYNKVNYQSVYSDVCGYYAMLSIISTYFHKYEIWKYLEKSNILPEQGDIVMKKMMNSILN